MFNARLHSTKWSGKAPSPPTAGEAREYDKTSLFNTILQLVTHFALSCGLARGPFRAKAVFMSLTMRGGNDINNKSSKYKNV